MGKMLKKTKFWLLLILILAGFLRFYQLADYPVGFHIDEASLGYNAYSLLKTARDENGQFLPLHIDMFGDQRPSGYQFLDILPVAILGLSEFATRLPSAIFGALTPLAMFFLARLLLKNQRRSGDQLGLVAAFLTAISPWHLVISRASAETIVALFLIILGAYFFLKSIKEKGTSFFWATFLWSVSLFFYHTSRVFIPMLGLAFSGCLFSHWWQKGRQFRLRLGLCLGLVILTALGLVFGSGAGSGRFQQVSILHFPEIRLVMEEQFREDGVAEMPVLAARFFHNKVVNYGLGYLKEYFRYFSPNYLFIEGGLPAWYLVPGMGLLLLVELPFLLIGLYGLVKKGGWFLVPVIWLVLGPVIAGLTQDDAPNVQRSLVMLPGLILISTYGFWVVWEWGRKKLIRPVRILAVVGLALVLVLNFSYFCHQYFVHGRLHRPWYRFNGFKEVVLAVNELEADYDKVVVSKTQGGTYMHFLFFSPFDPRAYQELGSPRDNDFGGFGKYVFVPQECPTQLPSGMVGEDEKVLYVASGVCSDPQFGDHQAKLIKREDGTVAFRISLSDSR